MKVPIPKKAVTQIMNEYNCSEEQAAKAYHDAQDKITKDMVQDEKYFDKLFSHWYENQKAKNAFKN